MPRLTSHDRQLSQLLEAYLNQTLASLPTEAELAATTVFSPGFEARMQPLLEQASRASRRQCGQQRQRRQSAAEAQRAAMPMPADMSVPAIEPVPATRPVPAVRPVPATRPAAEAGPLQAGESFLKLASSSRRALPQRNRRLLVAAIVLAILVSMFSMTAAREPVVRFLVQTYEKFSHIVFGTPETSAGQVPAVDKAPSWLPAGFVQSEMLETADSIQIIYVNEHREELIFERHDARSINLDVDTEGVTTETVTVGPSRGTCYVNKGTLTLIWQDGPNAYLISGRIDKESALKMANATK